MAASLSRILVVESRADDAEKLRQHLCTGGEFHVEVEICSELKVALDRAAKGGFDAAIVDLYLSDSQGPVTLELWNQRASGLPLVILCGREHMYRLPEALEAGAQDYLVKDDMDARLVQRVVINAIEKKRLEEKISSLSQMSLEYVSTVSHELRAPLAITREGVSIVLDHILGKISDKQAEVLKIAKRNIDRLDHIIMNMLDISKLEAGKMILNRGTVNLMELIKKIAGSFDERIREKGLTLRVTAPRDVLEVYADGPRIIEVLAHLVGNAVKFTKEGSIEIRVRETDVDVECAISDTGIGISPEDQPKVFRKFQQFAWVPGGGEKGMGLGLAIAKGIVDLHQGRITAVSEPGRGTTFTVTLPKPRPGPAKRR